LEILGPIFPSKIENFNANK